MITRLCLAATLVAGVLAARPGPAAASSSTSSSTILVATSNPSALPGLAGGHVVARFSHIGLASVRVPDRAAGVAAYRELPGVTAVEADRLVHAAAAPNDPIYPHQWNLQPLSPADPGTADWEPGYPAAQGAGVLIAVVDSGFRAGGTDQPANIRSDLSRNVIDGTSNAQDDFGHGTFVTNIIASATNNAIGAAGLAPSSQIVPIKALDNTGTATLSTVAAGIDYAVGIHAQVINLSLSSTSDDDSSDPGDAHDTVSPDPALCSAIANAATSAVVVAATGNDSTRASPSPDVDPVGEPADCPGALAVGGVSQTGAIGSYSNGGCPTAVVAPGGDAETISTDPSTGIVQQAYDGDPSSPTFGTFQYFSEVGTSMAAAHASAEAALLLGLIPGTSVSAVRRAMVATARDLGPSGWDQTFGYGAIDIAAAETALAAGHVPALAPRGYRTVTAAGTAREAEDPCATPIGAPLPRPPALPVVGTTSIPGGFWMVASDGGIFAFGDAAFYGSTGAIRLNKPIVGMAATPTGHGYWLVASDGGIFTFGDAAFYGTTSNLATTITGMSATPGGYWLVAADGTVYPFGAAPSFGAAGPTGGPVVGIAPIPDSRF